MPSRLEFPTQMAACLPEVDVAVLAGGLGTRLRSAVPDLPKILAPIEGRPFLDYFLAWIRDFAPRRIVLCLGYRADAVLRRLREHGAPAGLVVETVVEPRPLGTGGALRHARPRLQSNPVLVVNGDSYVDVDLCAFLEDHRRSRSPASLLCCGIADPGRYGTVDIGAGGQILSFREKSASPRRAGFVSAGMYFVTPALLDSIEVDTPASIERDVFQALPAGTLHAHVCTAPFIDIGTPESLSQATGVLPKLGTNIRQP